MTGNKTVREIMSPIEDYDMVGADDRLCDALKIIRHNYDKIQAGEPGRYHKTLFVKNAAGEIVGKLSMYDLIRGLVPESAKKADISKTLQRTISVKAAEAAEEIAEVQERMQWLETDFFELVHKQSRKKVRDVMSPLHPLLKEDDTINRAIYMMFKENIRQPMVVREGRIVGVVALMDIFPELLEIAGDVCFWQPPE
ncbi:MAG TPA: CBS domain-containing protein [Syntrophobacteraceae bacterium]|nr:CBS domain-containing protein [Syntrophobacteraceae bacterium]